MTSHGFVKKISRAARVLFLWKQNIWAFFFFTFFRMKAQKLDVQCKVGMMASKITSKLKVLEEQKWLEKEDTSWKMDLTPNHERPCSIITKKGLSALFPDFPGQLPPCGHTVHIFFSPMSTKFCILSFFNDSYFYLSWLEWMSFNGV